MEKETQSGQGMSILGLAAVVLRRWRLVALVAITTTLAAGAAVVLARPAYVSGTVLVPFSASQSRTQLVLGQLPAGLANLVGGSASGGDRLLGAILGSRTLADSVVARTARGAAQEAEIRRVLQEGVRVQRNPDGSVVVQVRARDPRLAMRIANVYPALVNARLARMSAEGALGRQAFLEAQVAAAREKLLRSEERLMAFQRDRSAPNVDEQARRTLDAAAELQRRIYEQELEVAELRRTLTPDHPRLHAGQEELAARREQLRRLTSGGGGASVFVPVGEGAELKLASMRLLREFAQHEKVYESLTAALVEAQIDANNDLPVLSVLDPALPGAPVRSLPKTAALAAALGVVLGLVAAFAAEAVARARRNPESAEFRAAWARFRAELGRPFGRRAERRRGVSMGD